MCSSIHSNYKGVALSLWIQATCSSHPASAYHPGVAPEMHTDTGFYSRHSEQEDAGKDDHGIEILSELYWCFCCMSLVSNYWTREEVAEMSCETEGRDSRLRESLFNGLSGKRQHGRLKGIQELPTFTESQSQGPGGGWVTTPKANCLTRKYYTVQLLLLSKFPEGRIILNGTTALLNIRWLEARKKQ